MKKRGEPVRMNDVIAYVITGDGQDYNKNAAERAYSPQEVSKPDSNLTIGNFLSSLQADRRL
jgi:DNA polymerase alpha subunit A